MRFLWLALHFHGRKLPVGYSLVTPLIRKSSMRRATLCGALADLQRGTALPAANPGGGYAKRHDLEREDSTRSEALLLFANMGSAP